MWDNAVSILSFGLSFSYNNWPIHFRIVLPERYLSTHMALGLSIPNSGKTSYNGIAELLVKSMVN